MTSDSNKVSANKQLPLTLSDADFGESDRVEMCHMASTQSSLGVRVGRQVSNEIIQKVLVRRGKTVRGLRLPSPVGPGRQQNIVGIEWDLLWCSSERGMHQKLAQNIFHDHPTSRALVDKAIDITGTTDQH